MIVGRVKLTDRKPPEGKEVLFFSNGDEERPCYGVYKKEKGFDYVIILDSSGEEDYYNLSDYSEWLDESTPAEDWVKPMPQDELIEEMWDEYSEHIGDNIYDLENVANRSVITERKFKSIIERYAINNLPSPPKK